MKSIGWILLAFIALLSRSPEHLLRPQFFAEDGWLFFSDAASHGFSPVFASYQGYLLLVPRLVAAAAAPLPWEWQPLLYAWAAAACTIYVVWRVFSARLPFIVAAISSGALLVVPHNGEVWTNLCCLHFILTGLLAINLIEPAPIDRREAVRRGIEVALACLTGPEIMILAPALIWRAWRARRDPFGSAMMLIALPAVALQLGAMAFGHRQATFDIVALVTTAVPAVIGYSQFLFAGAGRGTFVNLRSTYMSLQLVVGVGALVLALATALDSGNRRRLVAALIAVHAAAFLIAAHVATNGAHHIFPAPLGYGARYAYFPQVLAVWAIAWLFQGAWEQGRRRLAFACMALVPLLLVPISVARHWRGVTLEDLHWRAQVKEAKAGLRTDFVTLPDCRFPVPRRDGGDPPR